MPATKSRASMVDDLTHDTSRMVDLTHQKTTGTCCLASGSCCSTNSTTSCTWQPDSDFPKIHNFPNHCIRLGNPASRLAPPQKDNTIIDQAHHLSCRILSGAQVWPLLQYRIQYMHHIHLEDATVCKCDMIILLPGPRLRPLHDERNLPLLRCTAPQRTTHTGPGLAVRTVQHLHAHVTVAVYDD